MNRKVQVVENNSGKVVSDGEIELRAINYTPSEKEWFDIAWKNAVEDGLVSDKDRVEYSISFV